jgi:hypothetical protein
MQDGHRGQQSFVLDGANVGLGDDVIVNGGFDTDDWNKNANWTISGGVAISDGGSANNINRSDSLITGNTYKVSFDIVSLTDGSSSKGYAVRLGSGGEWSETFYSIGTHTVILTAITSSHIYINAVNSAIGTIDNVVALPINAKNHATTVFYGDELITNGGFETDTGTPPNGWYNLDDHTGVGTADATAPEGSNVVVVTAGSAGAAADSFRQVEADDLVIGRTYHCTFYAKTISGDTTLSAWVQNSGNDITTNQTITSSWVQYNYTFTAAQTNRDQRWWLGGSGVFRMDDVSVKEVGTATGWTDADQQLDIPQTALQSYNQLAWFNGKGGLGASSVSCTSGSAIAPLDPLTFSCWFSGSQTGQVGLIRHCNFNADGYGIYIVTNDNTEISVDTHHDSTVTTYTTTSGTKDLLNGDLNHIVVVIDKTGSSRRVYINGSLMEQSASSFSYDTDATSTIGIGQPRNTGNEFDGIINEVSIWGDSFTLAEVQELYNDGKALDATTHSAEANLKGYWRNNGLATWADRQDNITANNLTVNNGDQTILIPAGVDGSRDNQGFLMNRQKDTNALNLIDSQGTAIATDYPYVKVGGNPISIASFSFSAWIKVPRFINSVPIFKLGDDDNNHFQIYSHSGSAGKGDIRLSHEYGSTLVRLTTDGGSPGDNCLTQDTWHHIAFTATTTTIILYLDTVVQDISNTQSGSNAGIGDANTYIGYEDEADKHFTGQIDDVLVYDDVLSAAEVTRNYNAGKRSHR